MTREELKDWEISKYNEDTKEQLDYFINERECKVGSSAYIYSHEDGKLTAMKIKKIIARSDDSFLYNQLIKNEDILLEGEDEYNADTSAEFITDNDCYLVWFEYVE